MKKIYLILVCAMIFGKVIAQPNLVAHWNFDNGSTTEVVNGWTATVTGTPITTAGMSGQPNTALKFNAGTNLRYASDSKMNLTSWTFTAKVRLDGFYSGLCEANAILWRGQQFTSGYYSMIALDNAYDAGCGTYTPTKEVFATYPAGYIGSPPNTWLGNGNTGNPNPFIQTGQWYCVVGSYDAPSGRINLWVNGVHVVDTTWANQYNYGMVSPADLLIGTTSDVQYPYHFNGAIDDLKMYDGPMTNQQAVAQCSTTLQQPTLVAHWPFDNGSTTEVINGWTATATGTPTATAGMNGQPNTALKFNSGDYLKYASDTKMNLTSWTITAKVRPDGFYSGLCEINTILWRGDQYYGQHYNLGYTDNPYDNSCGVFSPTKEVFAGAPAGNVSFPLSTWLGSSSNPNPFIQTGQWYCVVLSYDATTGDLDEWVNGNHVIHTSWSNQYNYTSPADLLIGVTNNSQYPYFLNAAVDDIKLYNGPMTNQQAVAQCATTPQPTTLVAHWPFDNGSTTEVINGWTATVTGTPMATAGANGQPNTAMKFNSGTYLKYASDPKMNLTSWTITANVRADSFYNGLCQANMILRRGALSGSANVYMMEIFDNAYDLNCNIYSPTKEVFATNPAGTSPALESIWLGTTPPGNPNPFIQKGQWYCVVATYDAVAEVMKLWVNGVHVMTFPWTNQYNYSSASPMDLFIGSTGNSSYPLFFGGAIDDIKLYNGAVPDQQATAFCETCTNPTLVAHWNFDNNTDEQLHNWPYQKSGNPAPTAGMSGKPNTAMKFKTGEYLKVAAQPDMNLNSWTIATKIRPDGFYYPQCQTNSIVTHGTEGSGNFYSSRYTDNAFDNDNCGAYDPNKEVFTAKAAGTGFASSTWLGASSNPNPFIKAGQWYCVVVSYDAATGKINEWVDGNHVVSANWNNQYNYTSPADLYIGMSGKIEMPNYINAALDDIKIYSGAVKCDTLVDSICYVAPYDPTGITEAFFAEQISLYPNPANSTVEIALPTSLTNVRYTMTNTLGIAVKKGTINGSTSVDVSSLPAGLYIITTMHNGQVTTHKLMVQH